MIFEIFGGLEPMLLFTMLMYVNGGLEPRWAFFGGFEPRNLFPYGNACRWRFRATLGIFWRF